MKFSSFLKPLGIFILVIVIQPLTGFAQQGEPPFVPGQVVVAGAPADLPAGLQALKHLPHANLTVV
ncbi:MAG: hypothetical protein GTO53_14130, partial [Planctomycetales bacterium]|nr:hypothetical protein [Planctomycetales bacterium]